ncbi:MAG: hypothetical protein IJ834_08340 [Paludibacteraceae bacterium]|nr:hypothetical protein [Paludibacteraceae bacterium]
MKKVLVLIILVCVCPFVSYAQGIWTISEHYRQHTTYTPFSPVVTMPTLLTSTRSFGASERIVQSCQTSFSQNHTQVTNVGEDLSVQMRRVGHNPVEEPPGDLVPIQDEMYLMLILLLIYSLKISRSKR